MIMKTNILYLIISVFISFEGYNQIDSVKYFNWNLNDTIEVFNEKELMYFQESDSTIFYRNNYYYSHPDTLPAFNNGDLKKRINSKINVNYIYSKLRVVYTFMILIDTNGKIANLFLMGNPSFYQNTTTVSNIYNEIMKTTKHWKSGVYKKSKVLSVYFLSINHNEMVNKIHYSLPK